MYRLYVPNGGYVCKGSYVVQGEKYKVLGTVEDAKTYKSEDAAQNDRNRMIDAGYANIDYKVCIEEGKDAGSI